MNLAGSISKKERAKIFELFLTKDKIQFNEIEKALKIRSNMVAYHLEQLIKQKVIEKQDNYYHLTKNAQRYLPLFSNLTGKDLSPVPIVLVAVKRENKLLLMKRNKRPYKDYWGLIGGKLRIDENIKQASLRLIKEKTGIEGSFKKINAVLQEQVKDEIIKHNFILFYTTVSAKTNKIQATDYGELKWMNISDVKSEKIIPSDLWLIENKTENKIEIPSAIMQETEGELSSLKFIE